MSIFNKIKNTFKKKPPIEMEKEIRINFSDYKIDRIEKYDKEPDLLFVYFTNGKRALLKVVSSNGKKFIVSVGYLIDDQRLVLICSNWMIEFRRLLSEQN